MKDYHYIKCLNPRRILNRYTGEFVLVECGKCEQCLMKRSVSASTRCKIESAYHKYQYFVTLTFENKYLPCARLVECNDNENYDVVRESDGYILGNVIFPSSLHKNMLVKKCGAGFNRIPILDSKYPQLFLKRLRKRLNEKIRTFYCGEYGPKSFRPHFHFSIWFDQEETLSLIGQAIRASWPFGRIDFSLASGHASSYIASYLNCTCCLPKVLSLVGTKPFSHHSLYLGEQFFEGSIKEIQKSEYSAINKRRIFHNGLNTEVVLWRSLKNRIFPKLKGFVTQSKHLRILAYSTYAKIRNWTKETCAINQARFLTDYVRFGDFYHPDSEINDLLQVLRNGLNYYDRDNNGNIIYVVPPLLDYDKFERMIYKIILVSKYFLKVICGGDDSYHNVKNQLEWIEGYYDFLSYQNLKDQLDIQKHNKHLEYEFFYHNTLSLQRLSDYHVFKSHKAASKNMFKSFIKHKELNDLNKVFIY